MLSTRFNEAISKSASIVLVFNILDVYIKASASLTSYRYHHVDSLPVASLFLFAFSRYVHDFLCSVHLLLHVHDITCTLEHF